MEKKVILVEDLQEILKELYINEKEDRFLNKLEEILTQREKESKDQFLEKFLEAVREDDLSKKHNNIQNIDDKSDDKKATDDGEMLISDMLKEGTEERQKEKNQHEGEQEFTQDIQEENIEEELEEKYNDTPSELTLNQKKYAYIYEKAMKEYFKIKFNVEKQNVKNDELSYDDRNFLKILRLKEVAVKAETRFRNSTGSYIRDMIPEIANMEKENEIEIAKYKKEQNRIHEKSSDKINSIKNEIEDLANEIQDLVDVSTENSENNPSILAKISDKQAKYIELNQKLEIITPNALDVAREEMRNKQQDNIIDKEYGYVDKVKERKTFIPKDELKSKFEQKDIEKKSDRITETGAISSMSDVVDVSQKVKEKYESEIEEAISTGNYDVARTLNEEYVALINDQNKSDDKEIVKNATEFADKIDEEEKENEENEEEIDAVTYEELQDSYPTLEDVEVNKSGENELGERLHKDSVVEPEQLATNDSKDIEDLERLSKGEKLEKENIQNNLEEI